jgi:hypothetical protein
MRWDVPEKLTAKEKRLVKRMRRASKFFVFLREIRAELFDDEFQEELSRMYKVARGQPPIPPALLAMVTILQGYTGLSDADAVCEAEMDLRWQLVLGTIGLESAPFGQGTLVRFRERLIAHDMDKRLVDRTVQIAKARGGFGWQKLKAALDSSPLIGAGRVEDTWNLIGRATGRVLAALSIATDVPVTTISEEADLSLFGGSSLKASLDLDWDDPEARHEGLQRLLGEADRLKEWAASRAEAVSEEPPLKQALEVLKVVTSQDLEPDPDRGGQRIRRGVARDRIPSVGDPEMRHGRKSRSQQFNGYKRHVITVVGTDLIAGAIVFPANVPEHLAAPPLLEDVRRHGQVCELKIDRGYLASKAIPELVAGGGEVRCRPWTLRNRGRYTKDDFEINLEQARVTCPAGQTTRIRNGRRASFGANVCNVCPQKARCTSSERGRSLSIHPMEELLSDLRETVKSLDGRAQLRERTTVEHRLARVGQIQGKRARYKGTRKNTFDVRRASVINNLMVLAHMKQAA